MRYDKCIQQGDRPSMEEGTGNFIDEARPGHYFVREGF